MTLLVLLTAPTPTRIVASWGRRDRPRHGDARVDSEPEERRGNWAGVVQHTLLAELEARRIQVETIGNKVILRGTVRSWWQKKEAERVAWQAPGVTQVENQIEVIA